MATKTAKWIDPTQWRVVGQLRHDGVTYGTNEPMPRLTIEQAEAYVMQGTLVRHDTDTRVQDFLDAADAAILQRILDDRPSATFLSDLLLLAQQHSRSKILELALTIAVRGAPGATRSPR